MAYNKDLQVIIDNLNPEEIKESNIPYAVVAQECSDLGCISKSDKPKLLEVGLSAETIDRLPLWAEKMQTAQSAVKGGPQKSRELQKKWNVLYQSTSSLLKDVMKYYEFTFYRDKLLLELLDQVKKGNDYADFIEDCYVIVQMGHKNADKLQTTGFNAEKLIDLEYAANQLRSLRSELNNTQYSKSEAMLNRGKTFTLLKRDMDEVRRVGKFVFSDDPEHAKKYASEYNRKRQIACRRKKKKSADRNKNPKTGKSSNTAV